MCITSSPAELSNTKIMSIKLDEDYHLLAYSNKVKNLSKFPNSMILAVPGTLTQTDFYDTTAYAKFLEEIEMFRQMRSRSLTKGINTDNDTLSFETFGLGMYTVFLSESAALISDALKALPEEKRPKISDELLSFFSTHYHGWSLVVCVFDSEKAVDAQPIMFKYKPFNKNMLYFPGMDSHDGGAPNTNAIVKVDHYIISQLTGVGKTEFSDDCKVPEILQNREFYGYNQTRPVSNGDWYLEIRNNIPDNLMIRSSKPLIQKPELHEH